MVSGVVAVLVSVSVFLLMGWLFVKCLQTAPDGAAVRAASAPVEVVPVSRTKVATLPRPRGSQRPVRGGRVRIDFNPPMPAPRCDEEMPQAQRALRHAHNREVHALETKIAKLEAELVEARKLTDEELEVLLQAHYRKVLGSPEGRAMWLDLLAAAEEA